MRKRNRFLVALSIISFIIVTFISIYNADDKSDKQFFVGAYYVGAKGVKSNPKTVYNKMYSTYDIVQCATEPSISNKFKKIGNKIWLFETTDDIDASYIESYATTDINGLTVYKFTDIDNVNVIAPANVIFQTSNVEVQGGSSIMSFNSGSDFRFDITNVIWWCHIDKDVPNKHTEVIGKDGKYPTLSAGTVIGKITEDSIISVYRINEDGVFVNCSLSEYYLE